MPPRQDLADRIAYQLQDVEPEPRRLGSSESTRTEHAVERNHLFEGVPIGSQCLQLRAGCSYLFVLHGLSALRLRQLKRRSLDQNDN